MSEPGNATESATLISVEPDIAAVEESSTTVEPDPALPNEPIPHEAYLTAPLQDAFSRPSSAFSDVSSVSAENDDNPRGRLLAHHATEATDHRYLSKSPAPLITPPSQSAWKSKLKASWIRNKGLALVALAQFFGVMMSVTTRLLELDGAHGKGMHPFQILFARMIGTLVLSGIYQWLAKVEHAPFGPRGVWTLLLARGFGGFFGVFGMYYSLAYLPLSDATVITFLAPLVACWACSILLHEPFTRREQLAGLISLLGVILIARPTSLLPQQSTPDALPLSNPSNSTNLESQSIDPQALTPATVTPSQRLTAVGVALIGVLGAATAYTTIRSIGRRAHPLISVNYFAAFSTLISTLALLFLPSVSFRLPSSLTQWTYLIFLGVCGFVMQFLLTAGLAYEKSSRATNMVYTQMLFALAFDKVVWGVTPGWASLVGGGAVLGSALWVAVGKNNEKKAVVGDEEGINDEAEEEADGGRGPLRGVQEVQLRTLRV